MRAEVDFSTLNGGIVIAVDAEDDEDALQAALEELSHQAEI